MIANCRRAFSIIELLIVITIIGMLTTLLLPAVQSARSAARRTSCSNQLRQLAISFQTHHSTHGFLPSNGWGYSWVGDPDRGFGGGQPGSWMFNVLPYVEQTSVRDIALGFSSSPSQKKTAIAKMLTTIVQGFNCADRRMPQLLPINPHDGPYSPFNSDPVTEAVRADYAANGGDQYCNAKVKMTSGPGSIEESIQEKWSQEFTRLAGMCNGIVYPKSEVTFAQITDGTSSTYLVGEKFLQPEHYLDGRVEGDERTLYTGASNENTRWGFERPKHDPSNNQGASAWGSAHAVGLNMAFCDGSVQLVSYDIDLEIHKSQSNRRDDALAAAVDSQ
jgi:prepilin-type N-terminal cleavage/methylation domain-containing protein/prepilin-type processing-associated H-X9-DG protein